eukprot:4174663-Pleurochrysis_carterae.AAC.2
MDLSARLANLFFQFSRNHLSFHAGVATQGPSSFTAQQSEAVFLYYDILCTILRLMLEKGSKLLKLYAVRYTIAT